MYDNREVSTIFTGIPAPEKDIVELLCKALYSILSEDKDNEQKKAG